MDVVLGELGAQRVDKPVQPLVVGEHVEHGARVLRGPGLAAVTPEGAVFRLVSRPT